MHFIDLNSDDENLQSIVAGYIFFLSEKQDKSILDKMFKEIVPHKKMTKKDRDNYLAKMTTKDKKTLEVVKAISNCKSNNTNLFKVLNNPDDQK